jgi:hypothetical protein
MAERVFASTKKTADELKQIYEQRLDQQEEEHEEEIRLLKQHNKIDKEILENKKIELKNKNENLKHENK